MATRAAKMWNLETLKNLFILVFIGCCGIQGINAQGIVDCKLHTFRYGLYPPYPENIRYLESATIKISYYYYLPLLSKL